MEYYGDNYSPKKTTGANNYEQKETMKWSTARVNEIVSAMDRGYEVTTNPFWDGKPEWRLGNVLFEYTPDEVAELKRCSEDVIYFANQYCFAMTDDGVRNINLRDYQEDILRAYQQHNKVVFCAPRQIGKAQPMDAVVWKKEGKTRFGDLQIGDQIYDATGNLTNILGIYPQGIRDVYEITFADGTTVKSCEEHLWTVEDVEGNSRTVQLKDIRKSLLTTRGDYKWFVRTTEPVKFPEADLPMDPYFLGLLIGDGGFANAYVGFATIDEEILTYIKENALEQFDVDLKQYPSSKSFEFVFSKRNGKNNHITDILRELGLMGSKSEHKFIPKKYLYGSVDQRIALLQGLLDTDGSITEKSVIEFSTASSQLADDTQQLCESLGIIVRRTIKTTYYKDEHGDKIECLPAYRLKLQLPNGYKYPVFRLTRKQNKVRDKFYDWGYRRGIAKVNFVGRELVQCIEVDNKDHLYLTDHFIPTHNTVTTAIFLTWYLLFNTDKNMMILANNGTTSEELVDKVKTVLAHLPFFMKPGVIVNNVMSMKFDNGCRLFGRTTTKSTGIGFTIHFLYMDEFAHIHPNFLDPFYRSVYPTIAAGKNSRIIITSTPYGMNKFYEIYNAALKGENSYYPLKVDWWQVPGRDEAWKAKEIADLGSLEDFNQEYGCQFLSSSRLLLDSENLARIKKSATEFQWREIIKLSDQLIDPLLYEALKWHPKFDLETISANDRFVFSIDTAGGGGGDYTVINIFKLVPLSLAAIKAKKNYRDESDFLGLLQVGMFRSNRAGVEEIQPIIETLMYNVFGSDRCTLVLEMDFKGNLLYEKMGTHREFYNGIFVHTKHTENARFDRPGIKLNPKNKLEYCYEMRKLVKGSRIMVTEKYTFQELWGFGLNGKGSYSSQSGNDDCAMTIVNLCTYFSSNQYLAQLEDIYDKLPKPYRDAIAEKLSMINEDEEGADLDTDFLKNMMS